MADVGTCMTDADRHRRRKEIARALRAILPGDSIVCDDAGLRAYECDGLSTHKQIPLLAVLPSTADEVSAILACCQKNGIQIVPRGAGTSLSGGALPLADGILMSMMKFNRILDIDYDNRTVTAQTGVTNLAITDAVRARGFFYAPDPSSQLACSIGGNVAENSGGVHCLKYGLTTNNVLGAQIVLIDGTIINAGGKHVGVDAYDIMALMTGSEGLLGVVTEVTVRILPAPEHVETALLGFDEVGQAATSVADIIAAGIIPAGLEMMDQLSVGAIEDFCAAGYPRDVAALLIAELDGSRAETGQLLEKICAIAQKNAARVIRRAQDEAERTAFWAGRKAAFPAMARIASDYLCMDGSIPRAAIAHVLEGISTLSRQYGLAVANVFHAGDGNLHPLILYDGGREGETERAEALGADILKLCVDAGGALTGEHGVGVEKRDLMTHVFSQSDLDQQMRVKCAFDPDHLLNPGKVFPQLRRCAELGHMHVHKGAMPFPDLPRF